jgi:CheY-like chemotaxis protein
MTDQPRSSRGVPVGPRKGTVLLVDDERLVLRAYTRALARAGIAVEPVGDSREVAALLDAGGFDAVFCDYSMPGLDGMDILRLVRARDPDLPVVLVSGGAGLDEALASGALRCLLKPVDVDVLKRAAEDALRVRQLALLERQTRAMCEPTASAGQAGYQPIVRLSMRAVVGHAWSGSGFPDARPAPGWLSVCVHPGQVDARARAADLRAAGIRVAIPELGAATCGPYALGALTPDLVVLHPALAVRVGDDEPRRKLVEAMVALGRELGLLVVAAGVSSAAERDALAALGCDLMQGSQFGAATPQPQHELSSHVFD